MSARSFRSVFMVASCAGAALGCYLVSLRVASERAKLEDVENRIVLAQRDMRVLQTEIGTRGRLSQLERWNAGAFALSAPAADQFLKGSSELAKLTEPERKVDFKAPVYLASAPAPEKPAIGAPETDDSGAPAVTQDTSSLLHEASLKTETREIPARTTTELPPVAAISTDRPATAAKPVSKKSVEKPGLAAAHHLRAIDAQTKAKLRGAAVASGHDKAHDKAEPRAKLTAKSFAKALKLAPKKSVDKLKVVTAKALTKPVHMAKVDPLAPLPAKHSGHSKDVSAD
ncbi:MAG TPA: hypothetical protein VJ846_13590 [Sphingomicrobium sp.]|nr:hypothetical protein [Sphingomicrobium sp.]